MDFVLIGLSEHCDDNRMAPLEIDRSSPMHVYWYRQNICKALFQLTNLSEYQV